MRSTRFKRSLARVGRPGRLKPLSGAANDRRTRKLRMSSTRHEESQARIGMPGPANSCYHAKLHCLCSRRRITASSTTRIFGLPSIWPLIDNEQSQAMTVVSER